MADIQTAADVRALVDAFYGQAMTDPMIGHFFTEVVPLDLAKHLPILYAFWESVLLGMTTYSGNPMRKHLEINAKSPLTGEHLQRWLELWRGTVQRLFDGNIAREAITRAESIAGLMQHKIEQQNQRGFIF